jgi:hypothetical protein
LVLFWSQRIKTKVLKLYLSVVAVWKQFYGYGIGFIESFIKVIILKKEAAKCFPELFFKV